MKFKIFFLLFLILSCTPNYTKLDSRKPYNSKGFAYIFNTQDLKTKIINIKMDNNKLQIAHNTLSTGSLIKLINPQTKEYLVLKNSKKTDYPDFYKILITKAVADKLSIDINLPLIEILEIKKNKSFVAKKAQIFNEEKKISSKAPVTSVQIANISKNNQIKKKTIKNNFYILIATFYKKESAEFLRKKIIDESSVYDVKKLKIKKKNNNEINLISGPYSSINLMKNDYITLKNFGFEELDISINE